MAPQPHTSPEVSVPAGYAVVRLGPDDLELMRGALSCLAGAFEDPETYLQAQPDDAYLARLLADPTCVVLTAVQGHTVCGVAIAYEVRKFEQPRSELYLYDLGVDEAHRRRGLATALILSLRPIAREMGAWVIFVQADAKDEHALALYESVGVREPPVFHFDIAVD